MWNKLFKRNIVFAVCAVRRDSLEWKLPQINIFVKELLQAPSKSFKNRDGFTKACQRQYPDIKDPMGYLNRLHFSMSEAEERDIEFFLNKANQHGLLDSRVIPDYFTPALELAGNGESNA